ncbi:aldehyde dehydrogenase family protein [Streptomyces sp. NPDC088725]|uniref:aldehyde dehydrogenase family protein n=1 Tax=Streptomyces sp. NPDC088725 TaxID=3365873 RepID=UPI0038054487
MSYFTELGHQYIDGEWRTGSGSWDIIDFNPYNGEKLASITVATTAEVDEAYRAAERAQPGWAAAAPATRAGVFGRAVALIEEREDDLVLAIAEELGGTRSKALLEISSAQEQLRRAALLAELPDGQLAPPVSTVSAEGSGSGVRATGGNETGFMETGAKAAGGKENRVYRQPVGVVGVINPCSFPFAMAIMSAAPALALGNAVVIKPNQNSPLTGGGLVARLFEDAGLPPGLLNIVVTDIAEIGDALIEHPVPRVISFAGSGRVGRHIGTVAARHLKRTVMQLSGNSTFLVLADVDEAGLDHAVESAVASRFVHQGQICTAAGRILVDRAVEREFTERFVAKVAALKTGDPREPDTRIGPLINSAQADAVAAVVAQALAEGATALVRGRTLGNLVEPTVLTGLPEDSAVLRQEIFGPVALLVPFDGDDEGVRLANDSPHGGPSAAVHTADVERGIRVARRVGAGIVHINDSTVRPEPLAIFGAGKRSGLGRLDGEDVVEVFTTQKWISVQHGRTAFAL